MLPLEPLLSQQTPFVKLLILILIILASAIFTMLLGVLVLVPFYGTGILEKLSDAVTMANTEDVTILKFMQVINQMGIFIIPSLVFAYLENRRIFHFLTLDKKVFMPSVLMVSMLVFTFLPFTHWLVEINESMYFPEFLGVLERWMKNSEESAARLTEAFLKTDSLSGLFINVIIVGVLAAVGEELLFRSVLINLFKHWFKNVHFAVFLSALLFSAFHLQFYGFLPRFILGLLFGYLFVWSGTVWLPVIAHFLNNTSAVVVYYLFDAGTITTEAEKFGATDNRVIFIMSIIFSMVLLAGIFVFEKRQTENIEKYDKPEIG